MLDWLLIGGGIHGVHIAARLIGEAGADPGRLRILDPGAGLLSRWRACTAATGMSHLRSPSVHHLDLDPRSLDRFAGEPGGSGPGLFAPPYKRPSLRLFNDHCDHVIATFGLAPLQVRARARRIAPSGDHVRVETSAGDELRAARVVLAIGTGDQLQRPPWAPAGADPRIRHIFDPDFRLDEDMRCKEVVVVGGGISAAQVALWLGGGPGRVHMVSRHAPREHQFDSDPGWLGPKLMRGFEAARDPVCRRALIGGARHRGSLPPEIAHALRRSMDKGLVHWHLAEVRAIDSGPDGLCVRLCSGTLLHADQILLATGFQTARPGGPLVDALIEEADLPCASCGYPLVDAHLRWHPRIYATGPLAELTLGPAARNIAGARRAGDRILAAQARWV